jgi:hypothetical protein
VLQAIIFRKSTTGEPEAVQKRVCLRHFLLTVGAKVDRERRQQGTDKGNDSSNVDSDSEAQIFAIEQRRLAVTGEAVKGKRYISSRAIQKFFRHCHRLMLKNEEELHSTSANYNTDTVQK